MGGLSWWRWAVAAAFGCVTGCAAAQSGPSGAAAAHLYWANGGTHPFHSGTIVEANLNGTQATTIAKHRHVPLGLAAGP
jgi:hypothetical protein